LSCLFHLIPYSSALSKAGKTTLIIDPHDTYGSDFASFQLNHLDELYASQQCASDHEDAGTSGCVPATTVPTTSTGLASTGGVGGVGGAGGVSEVAGEGSHEFKIMPLRQHSLPLTDVEVFVRDGADLGNTRSYILDLAPKVRQRAQTL
jgi:RAB protein geranylgeranyltransferase component A